MRQRNHCSSLNAIPKMKLQDSGPSGPKSLQSQNRPRPENRLSISRLDVVHAQLVSGAKGDDPFFVPLAQSNSDQGDWFPGELLAEMKERGSERKPRQGGAKSFDRAGSSPACPKSQTRVS